jgi:hypothetical protein
MLHVARGRSGEDISEIEASHTDQIPRLSSVCPVPHLTRRPLPLIIILPVPRHHPSGSMMPTSDDSGSSTPDLDRSIIHDIRPGLFEPPRYSITPPRPRRVKSYRSIRRDGREYSRADQRYFILELHQRLLRVIAERNATGEAEPPPRYMELAKTPFNWSHYDNVPKHERSERMDLNGMDKLEEERLFQITVKALLKQQVLRSHHRDERGSPRADGGVPSCRASLGADGGDDKQNHCRRFGSLPNNALDNRYDHQHRPEAVVPRNAGDTQSQSSPLAPRSEGIASPYRLVAIILRPHNGTGVAEGSRADSARVGRELEPARTGNEVSATSRPQALDTFRQAVCR